MPTKIEFVTFDPYAPSSVMLGHADEIIGVDTKVYNTARQPYLIIKRASPSGQDEDVVIWTVSPQALKETQAPADMQMTEKGKLFVFQRISDGGARTGNYSSYLAWMIAVDCSGRRKPVKFSVVENGMEPFESQHYVGTFGKMDRLFNLFAERAID